MADEPSFFNRLTRLFRSGPIVKRKVRAYREPTTGTAIQQFQRSQSHVYANAISAYGMYDRMSRYADFQEMEATPEIASALDIYSDETVAQDEVGQTLHIYSENEKIRKILEELFYDNLNIDFNLNPWVRNLCKYGDFFLFLDISPEYGVLSAFPVPVNEIEREEGFDPEDPLATRFRWVTQGNKILENWQIGHFRLLGNDAFLPYGSSVIEPARRIWRQLIMIEDAMLVYRVIRSPERRVFKIDVGNVPPEEVENYMQQAKAALRSSQVIDKSTGRVDMRYNPLSVDEDYFLPVRGQGDGTEINTLAGGQNTTAIEDVEYIQKKLFSALKIPKAYLGYDENLSSKATLAQEDIRFSRTIGKIQKVVISELNKIAAIHLFANGFEDEDLVDFQLKLSNPSTIAQQQKLELYRSKFEIAGQAPDGVLSRDYIRKQILGLTSEQIRNIEKEKDADKLRDLEVEAITLPASDVESVEAGAEFEAGEEEIIGDEEEEAEGGLETSSDKTNRDDLLLTSDPNQPPEDTKKQKITVAASSPVKASSKVRKPRSKRGGDGRTDPVRAPYSTGYTGQGKERHTNNRVFDREIVKGSDLKLEEQEKYQNNMTATLKKTLKKLEGDLGNNRKKSSLITEGEGHTDGET